MDAKELAQLPANRVRNNQELMRLYIEKYEAVFFSKPDCAGCSFTTDFTKFQNAVLNGVGLPNPETIKKQKAMAEKSFELKREFHNDIFTYRIGAKPYRSYGYTMTEEFAKNLLSEGTKEEIEERKKKFAKLPESNSKSVSTEVGTNTLETEEKPAEAPKTAEKGEKKAVKRRTSKKSKK